MQIPGELMDTAVPASQKAKPDQVLTNTCSDAKQIKPEADDPASTSCQFVGNTGNKETR